MTKYIDTRSMTHHQWLKARRQGIGGSDAAAVLGLSQFQTPLDIYNSKINGYEIEETPRMRAGKRLEATIAEWWAEEQGFKIQRENRIRLHPEYPFLIANLDRVILNTNGNERGTGILEVKNTNGFTFKTWEEDGLPLYTFCQVQHYLNVTGYSWAAIAVLVDGYDLHSIDVEPDLEFIRMMAEREKDFWFNHVEKRIPPDPISEDDIKALYPMAEKDKELEAVEDTYNTFIKMVQLHRKIEELKEKENILKVALQKAMGNAQKLNYLGQRLASFKNIKKFDEFDVKRFAEERPGLYKKYLKEAGGGRRFLPNYKVVAN